MPSWRNLQALPGRPRATAIGAFLEGWRRTLRAPAITAGVLVLTILTALPLALTLRAMLGAHLGSSLTADRLLHEWDDGWAAEFGAQAQGIGATFTREILGFGGTMAAVSAFLDAAALTPAAAGAVASYIALWVFLSGGILDRFARARPLRAAAFFSACGVYFIRFLRLAVVIGACYWALFRWLHPLLFRTLWDWWTRDLTRESTAFAWRAGLYAIFLTALMLVSLLADFAKVRAVVEDRRSMIGALVASLRFVRRRIWRVAGLYLLNVVAALILAGLWRQAAPSAAAAPWLALAIAQIYVAGRIAAKLAFMASEVAFFQGELAHAQYTAAPEPVWPDSPAVEAIGNGRGARG